MKKKSIKSLVLNKKSISTLGFKLGGVGVADDGSMAACSEVHSCFLPTEHTCPPPPPASYTYCVPNNGPCFLPER